MAFTLDIAMTMAMLQLHHFYKLDNVCTLTRVGEYRKIPAFGLWSSLDLMLVFPCTPLLSSRYRLNPPYMFSIWSPQSSICIFHIVFISCPIRPTQLALYCNIGHQSIYQFSDLISLFVQRGCMQRQCLMALADAVLIGGRKTTLAPYLSVKQDEMIISKENAPLGA